MDRAGFDPRYSPEFQRGFDPAANHEAPASAAPAERIEPVPVAHVPKPIARKIPPAPTREGAPAEPSAATWADDMFGPAEAVDEERPAGERVSSELTASPWRNPYLIALTIAGVVLVAGGIGAFRWAVQQVFGGMAYATGATQADMEEAVLTAQLAWGLSPLLALAGVLTLLGVLFFVAWRWLPQRRHTDDESDEASSGSPAD